MEDLNIKVRVSSPSRLHLGEIDPFGLGRFGYSILLGIKSPRTTVEVERSNSLEVELAEGITPSKGEEDERKEIRRYAEKILDKLAASGAKISVISRPPRHYGFGSTTQLSLSVGSGICRAYEREADPIEIMNTLGRASSGGVHTFQGGGFVVAGGFERPRQRFRTSARGGYSLPPLILRKEFPEEWRFVVAWPRKAPPGPSGREEEDAFKRLQRLEPPEDLIHEAHFLVNTGLVPAVLEEDPVKFGEALSGVQSLVGELYSPVQEDTYNPVSKPLLDRLSENEKSLGVGQSSWGPAVYSLAASESDATEISEEIRETAEAEVSAVAPDNKGRQIEKVNPS